MTFDPTVFNPFGPLDGVVRPKDTWARSQAMPASQARAGAPSERSPQAVSGIAAIPIAGHTPLPWFIYAHPISGADDAKEELAFQVDHTDPIGDRLFMLNADGKCPALTGCGPTSEANAAFIVRACNSHYELLEALKELAVEHCAHYCDPSGATGEIPHTRFCDKVRALIAKATGAA